MADAENKGNQCSGYLIYTKANTVLYPQKKSLKKDIPVSNCQDISKTSSDALKPGYAIVSQKINMNETATCHLNGP